jgi:biopolymer transport protein TolQ
MTTKAAASLSTWTLISDAGPLVKFILLILFAASVLTWAIIAVKWRMLRDAKSQNREFLDLFWSSNSLDEVREKSGEFPASPISRVFVSGYQELQKLPMHTTSPDGIPEVANITRALERAHSLEIDEMEKYVDWLASTASAAPFVGLFGTVWGIMGSFQSIGAMGSASLAVVAPGISEALIATAMGLAAAIPAAIAYNILVNRMKKLSLEMESFSQEFINMVQRSLLSGRKGATSNGNEPESSL